MGEQPFAESMTFIAVVPPRIVGGTYELRVQYNGTSGGDQVSRGVDGLSPRYDVEINNDPPGDRPPWPTMEIE